MQKTRPDMDIGNNIQNLRKAASLTQEQTVARLQLMNIKQNLSVRYL